MCGDSYNQFVEETSKLSVMDTYAQLQQRVGRIGLRVDKVVYRGYHATEQMQVCMCVCGYREGRRWRGGGGGGGGGVRGSISCAGCL